MFLLSVALIALLAELAYGVINNSTLPVYVKYGLGLPKWVGTSVAAFLLAETLLTGPTGLLADRIGRRALMVGGPLISVCTTVALTLLQIPANGIGHVLGIAALLTLRFLDGAGAAALWPAVFASIGDRVAPEKQASAMSVLNVSYMIGVAAGPLLGGILEDHYAHKLGLDMYDASRYMPSLFAAAGAFFLTGLIGFIAAPGRGFRRAAASSDGGTTSHAGEGAPVTIAAIIDALRQIPMLILLVFVLFFGIGLIAPNVKLYALEHLHVTPTGFAFLLLKPALVVGVLAIPLGRLGDVWGRVVAIRAGCGVAAVSLWLILLFESPTALVVIGCLLGVGFILAFPAYLALISTIGGDSARGSVIGAVKTFQGVGMLIGAVIGSPLYQKAPLSPFILAAILLTTGFIISLVAVREPKRA